MPHVVMKVLQVCAARQQPHACRPRQRQPTVAWQTPAWPHLTVMCWPHAPARHKKEARPSRTSQFVALRNHITLQAPIRKAEQLRQLQEAAWVGLPRNQRVDQGQHGGAQLRGRGLHHLRWPRGCSAGCRVKPGHEQQSKDAWPSRPLPAKLPAASKNWPGTEDMPSQCSSR